MTEPIEDATIDRRKSWLKAQLDGKQAIHGIYVELVVLAVIIALEGKRTSDSDVLLSLFGAIVAIALAELYAYYVGTMIASGRKPSRREFLAAVGDTAAASSRSRRRARGARRSLTSACPQTPMITASTAGST